MKMSEQQKIIKYLKQPHSIDEIHENFTDIHIDQIKKIIDKLVQKGQIRIVESNEGAKYEKTKHDYKFNPTKVRQIAELAGYICTNPPCKKLTIAPSKFLPEKIINIGEAAHINGNKPSSARFEKVSGDYIESIENGIWLCRNCHKKIDANKGIDYKVETLKSWKTEHSELLRENLGEPINLFLKNLWISNYVRRNLEVENTIEVLNERIYKIKDYGLFKFRSEGNKDTDYRKIIDQIITFNKFQTLNEEEIVDEEEHDEVIDHGKNYYILKGESGVGKTQFLEFLKNSFIKLLHENKTNLIPVLIKLKYWSSNKHIFELIYDELKIPQLRKREIKSFLIKGRFLILLDGYNEVLQNYKTKFLQDLLKFKDDYPDNSFLISLKIEHSIKDLKEYFPRLISMEPPDLEDLEEHIRINSKIDPQTFFSEIEDKNLTNIAKLPLFLNYLIIYFKNFNRLPISKYKILENLINNYFEKHIRNNEIKLKMEFDIVKIIISFIAYNMIFKKRSQQLTEREYQELLMKNISDLKKEFLLNDSINAEFLTKFFLSYNILSFKNNYYSFWHPILLEYFCAFELANQINNETLTIQFEELIEVLEFQNYLIISFPLIENELFKKTLKDKNIFLFIESLLEKSDLKEVECQFILKILFEKLNSDYRFIQEKAFGLIEKFLRHSKNPEKILIDIINQKNEPEIKLRAILGLGKVKSQKAYNFLLNLDNFNLKTDRKLLLKPINGYKILALSNFANIEAQDYIINELEREWVSLSYLKMIGMAIFNITHRKELSLNSFRKIMRIYNEPADFDIQLSRNSIKIDIRDSLEEVIIEYNNPHVSLLLFDILKRERHTFHDFNTIMILSKIIRNADLPLLIAQIKNHNISINFRGDLAYILLNSELMMDFKELFDILEYIKNKDFIPDSSDLNELIEDYDSYIRKHPAYVYSRLFGIIAECFLKDNRIKNFNRSKLLEFLKPYLEYYDSYIQEIVIEIFGKYNPEILFEKISFFFRRSLLKYLEQIIPFNEDKAISKIKKYSERILTEPDDFYNYMLFASMIDLLLKYNFIEVSEDLFDKYITTEIDYGDINLSSFRFISNFSKDYTIKILNHFKEKFYQLSDDRKFSRLRQLIVFVPPIEDDRYVKFCLEISKNFPRAFDFAITRIFNNLISLNPLKFECEIIDLFQTKIRDGYIISGALNILAFIGTDKSINFLSQFLEDTNDILRQKSFYCIRKIKERNNIDWYKGEEIFC